MTEIIYLRYISMWKEYEKGKYKFSITAVTIYEKQRFTGRQILPYSSVAQNKGVSRAVILSGDPV